MFHASARPQLRNNRECSTKNRFPQLSYTIVRSNGRRTYQIQRLYHNSSCDSSIPLRLWCMAVRHDIFFIALSRQLRSFPYSLCFHLPSAASSSLSRYFISVALTLIMQELLSIHCRPTPSSKYATISPKLSNDVSWLCTTNFVGSEIPSQPPLIL